MRLILEREKYFQEIQMCLVTFIHLHFICTTVICNEKLLYMENGLPKTHPSLFPHTLTYTTTHMHLKQCDTRF